MIFPYHRETQICIKRSSYTRFASIVSAYIAMKLVERIKSLLKVLAIKREDFYAIGGGAQEEFSIIEPKIISKNRSDSGLLRS